LLVKEQADPLFMEALEYAEQVGQRSTEPIHGPSGVQGTRSMDFHLAK